MSWAVWCPSSSALDTFNHLKWPFYYSKVFDSLSVMGERSLGDKLVGFQCWVMSISHIYVCTKKLTPTTKRNKANRTRQNRGKYFSGVIFVQITTVTESPWMVWVGIKQGGIWGFDWSETSASWVLVPRAGSGFVWEQRFWERQEWGETGIEVRAKGCPGRVGMRIPPEGQGLEDPPLLSLPRITSSRGGFRAGQGEGLWISAWNNQSLNTENTLHVWLYVHERLCHENCFSEQALPSFFNDLSVAEL